ncbi:MAG: hypothetical protein Kapaf2KO_02980 [Candidatus Kapaibacteriales bacterium]
MKRIVIYLVCLVCVIVNIAESNANDLEPIWKSQLDGKMVDYTFDDDQNMWIITENGSIYRGFNDTLQLWNQIENMYIFGGFFRDGKSFLYNTGSQKGDYYVYTPLDGKIIQYINSDSLHNETGYGYSTLFIFNNEISYYIYSEREYAYHYSEEIELFHIKNTDSLVSDLFYGLQSFNKDYQISIGHSLQGTEKNTSLPGINWLSKYEIVIKDRHNSIIIRDSIQYGHRYFRDRIMFENGPYGIFNSSLKKSRISIGYKYAYVLLPDQTLLEYNLNTRERSSKHINYEYSYLTKPRALIHYFEPGISYEFLDSNAVGEFSSLKGHITNLIASPFQPNVFAIDKNNTVYVYRFYVDETINPEFTVPDVNTISKPIVFNLEIYPNLQSEWVLNDTIISTMSVPNLIIDTPGIFSLTRHLISGSDTLSYSQAFEVVPVFNTEIILDSTGFSLNKPAILRDGGNTENGIAIWNISNGSKYSGDSISFMPKAEGEYSIVLTRHLGEYYDSDTLLLHYDDLITSYFNLDTVMYKQHEEWGYRLGGGDFDEYEMSMYYVDLFNLNGYIGYENYEDRSHYIYRYSAQFSAYRDATGSKRNVENLNAFFEQCVCSDCGNFEPCGFRISRDDANDIFYDQIRNTGDGNTYFKGDGIFSFNRGTQVNIEYGASTPANLFFPRYLNSPLFWDYKMERSSFLFTDITALDTILEIPFNNDAGLMFNQRVDYFDQYSIFSYLSDGFFTAFVIDSNMNISQTTSVPLENYSPGYRFQYINDSIIVLENNEDNRSKYALLKWKIENDRIFFTEPLEIEKSEPNFYLGDGLWARTSTFDGNRVQITIQNNSSKDIARVLTRDTIEYQINKFQIGTDGVLYLIAEGNLLKYKSITKSILDLSLEKESIKDIYPYEYLSVNSKDTENPHIHHYYYHQGTIYSRNNTENNITVFDLTGREILYGRMTSSGLKADLSRGVYLVTDGKTTSKIFVE